MKAADTKQQGSPSQRDDSLETDSLDTNWGGVFYPIAPDAGLDEWRPGFWDALVGYWDYVDPDRLRDPATETRMHRSSDDEDFSSEHGYEPEFEGRSEFEHGEFERWL
ncbi:MAG: hypothetical protein RL033_7725 [Pseudomonadota bacterium]|jgi:hypothetical protein